MSFPAWKTMDQIWDQVEPTGFCWLWTGPVTDEGYGYAWIDGTTGTIHRIVYEALIGPVPEGLVLDHLCRIRNCVNPDHLEPVTASENSRRSNVFKQQRDLCLHGHLWTPENTLPLGDSIRCRECILVRTHAKRGKPCDYDTPCWVPSHNLAVYASIERTAA